MKLEQKVAVVTGAGSGIGRATAIRFAAEGASVIVAELNEGSGKETEELITESGGVASFVQTDVTSYDAVQNAVNTAVEQYGKLDIMFNNAGTGTKPTSVLDMSIGDYDKTIAVNQYGVFYGIKAAGNAMKDHGGVIINTASIYAFIADRNRISYHASKGAVVSMTKSAAFDLAKYNIRVNAIAPGLIETGIVTDWKNQPEVWEQIERAQMRRKAGQPDDVAKLVTFLASDDASFLNAHVHYVDDGAAAFKR
ncbi:short-chain dehydrogenase [Bacillaceae bacterium JMAK1]|nr:short-chain dehydrogenase [Bacillaceae bacterium JMAK1]